MMINECKNNEIKSGINEEAHRSKTKPKKKLIKKPTGDIKD